MMETCTHYAAHLRRKPLPYCASNLIEDAQEECRRAKKALTTILEKPLAADERYRLIALALNGINEAVNKLSEIPVMCSGEDVKNDKN